MLRYAKLSAKKSLGMTLLIQKYNFMSVKLSLAFLFVDSTKEMETNDLKCLKIQFKVGSLLSFVLCVDTTLILEVFLYASA